MQKTEVEEIASLSQDERVLLFETFDLLHQAEVETER